MPIIDKTPFPRDWNQWRALWEEWLEVGQFLRSEVRFLQRTSYRFEGGKNFLAEEILGVFRDTHTGRLFELSESTFLEIRGIGITEMKFVDGELVIDHDGASGVVHSFAELETVVFDSDYD